MIHDEDGDLVGTTVRFVNGTLCFVNRTVRFVNDTVRFVNGTVGFLRFAENSCTLCEWFAHFIDEIGVA